MNNSINLTARAVSFLASLCILTAPALAADTPARPNLVLLLIDDMGYGDIGPFGSAKNRTPQLERMAREGMKLTSFYGASVCTPSRAQVLTGCYAKRVSLPDVLFPASPIGLNAADKTVAEVLKTAGYATMCIGKWHVGDQPEFLPTRHGFDHYFGLPYSNDMGGNEYPAQPGAEPDPRPPLPLVRDDRVIETVPPAAQDRLTQRYTEEAVKFIRQKRHKPFFLYLPHTAVHVPLHPRAKFRGRSANGMYGDWVEEVDWSVGRVLDTLRELKLAEKTLVIFTSDNGPWLTQGKNGGTAGPLRGGKGGTYEGGVREPTLAWWPGHVPAESVCDAVAGNIDLLPTFAALAGAALPGGEELDGRDLTPLLLGRSQESPHEAYFYFAGNALQAVRSGPWKLAVARQSENTGARKNTAKPGEPATAFAPTLFNLDQDIGEQMEVAAQYPEVVNRLQGFIAQMGADLGVTNSGPGVRPPGRVAHPAGLYLPGHHQVRGLAGTSHWEVYSSNPVLRPGVKGGWDAGALGSMTVLKVGDLFHMYYEAWGVRGQDSTDYSTLQIGHASSRDGVRWTKDPANPVLPKGTGEDWDCDGTWDPFVLYEDGVFKMWYGGGMDQHCDWGYAVSTNGVHFVKQGQLSHLGNVEDDHVVHDKGGGHYFMYYWDRKHEPMGLFRAQSPNETDFDFAHAEPIRIEGLKYPAMYKFTHVFQEDGGWHMFFGEFVRPGCKGCWTGYATSSDGVRWQAQNRRLLLGQDAEILKAADDLYLMYYGPDGYFDQRGCDIRLSICKGPLSGLTGKDGD